MITKGKNNRAKKVAAEINRILSELFLKDEDLMQISITKVEVSDNLRFSKVFYICPINMNKDDAAMILDIRTKILQKKLSEILNLKYATTLSFYYDKGFEYSIEVDKILEEIKQESN